MQIYNISILFSMLLNTFQIRGNVLFWAQQLSNETLTGLLSDFNMYVIFTTFLTKY